MARRMYATDEAAEYLGTSVRHLRRLVSDHHLAHYKVGGRLRFADVDLDAWLAARRIAGRHTIGMRTRGASPIARP